MFISTWVEQHHRKIFCCVYLFFFFALVFTALQDWIEWIHLASGKPTCGPSEIRTHSGEGSNAFRTANLSTKRIDKCLCLVWTQPSLFAFGTVLGCGAQADPSLLCWSHKPCNMFFWTAAWLWLVHGFITSPSYCGIWLEKADTCLTLTVHIFANYSPLPAWSRVWNLTVQID